MQNIQQEKEEIWDLPETFDLYAKAELRTVFYPHPSSTISSKCDFSKPCLKIECIEPSTPLDICNTQLSSIEFDGTGHCTWSGAFLLIECMDQILDVIKYVMVRKRHSGRLQMIELGCGTGIGGLSVLKQMNRIYNQSMIHCYFTDADPAVLKICERNCQWNQINSDEYSIQKLLWGTSSSAFMESSSFQSFQIVLATDVLYDIDLIHPLFTTASQLLSNHDPSVFILSHIPRACYNYNNPPEAMKDLQKHIIDQANKFDLELWRKDDDHHRPFNDGLVRPSRNEPSVELLEFCSKNAFDGAVIFIFQKIHDGNKYS